MIPYGRQNITEADISAVVEVLQSTWLTQGPGIAEFESTVALGLGPGNASKAQCCLSEAFSPSLFSQLVDAQQLQVVRALREALA